METSNSKIPYLDLWKDICFFDVYSDNINFKNYIIYLSQKYLEDPKTILKRIKKVRSEASERIKKFNNVEKEYPSILNFSCEEESILYEIKYNRKRDEIQNKLLKKESSSNILIKSINEIKAK